MVNVQRQKATSKLLRKLNPDTQPKFGIMTPQHMVEHLILLVKLSNGGIKGQLMQSKETAVKWKQSLIYTDMEFPMGVRIPGEEESVLTGLRYENLEKAVDKLEDEIKKFEDFFQNNSHETTMHPALGLLNHEEWTIFHNKHFTHHFKQFGLD